MGPIGVLSMFSKYFDEQKIGVIGFNARPIACSVKKLGGRVFVSDYWGDGDLPPCVEEWVSVLNPQPGYRQRKILDQPMQKYLVENFLEYFNNLQLDHVLIGGGFDDSTEYLDIIEEKYRITGNSSKQIEQARNRDKILPLAEEAGFQIPLQISVKSLEGARAAAEEIGYPCVIRPVHSGGGFGIHLIHNDSQMQEYFARNTSTEERIIQQMIWGRDGSVSLLSTGDDAKTLSIQGQMIGFPSAGLNCSFGFCGNYIPFILESKIQKKIHNAGESVVSQLGLIGSNGIDYVVDKEGGIWFMEINPRFQATLEMLEEASSISVTQMHVEACKGQLPTEIPKFQPACKMIVYSRKDGLCPDLTKFPSTVDRTPEGVRLKKGDPICSIVHTDISLNTVYSKTVRNAQKIIASIR